MCGNTLLVHDAIAYCLANRLPEIRRSHESCLTIF